MGRSHLSTKWVGPTFQPRVMVNYGLIITGAQSYGAIPTEIIHLRLGYTGAERPHTPLNEFCFKTS